MKYELNYYEIMLRQNSKTAEEISKIRWNFIKRLNPERVLDYGCGVGWFRAFRPKEVNVETYDIGEFPQTGISGNDYDVLCLWDVLEHLPDFSEIEDLLKNCKYVALSVPIVPNKKNFKIEKWKHFKPGEHLHYFTEETLEALLNNYGFELYKKGNIESPVREDIKDFIFKNTKICER